MHPCSILENIWSVLIVIKTIEIRKRRKNLKKTFMEERYKQEQKVIIGRSTHPIFDLRSQHQFQIGRPGSIHGNLIFGFKLDG